MIKIGYYKVDYTTLSSKLLCSLIQKCYESLFTVNILTNNRDETISLDSLLWTYSKKKFIPHATNYDKLKEKQKILISDNVFDINKNAKANIFAYSSEDIVHSVIQNTNQLERILYYSLDNSGIDFEKFSSIISSYLENKYCIDYYICKKDGTWDVV